jgi:hypothetical protein
MANYQELFKQASSHYYLRSTIGSTSCKPSSLMYIIIHLLIQFGKDIQIPELTKKILQLNYDSHEVKLLKRILQNRPEEGEIIENVDFLKTVRKTWYIGLVTISQDGMVEGNVIDHYFLILQKEDGFHIISSYGCSLTYIKQTDTKLDLDEFQSFIESLHYFKKEKIRTFIKKHFLNVDHYVKKSVDPDENGKTHTNPEDIELEIENYTTRRYWMESFPVPVILQSLVEHELSNAKKGKTIR